MRETDISVFVDESGSFDSDDESSRFYLICLVIHDQRETIADGVAALEDALAALGLEREHCVHAGRLYKMDESVCDHHGKMGKIWNKCFVLDKKFVTGDAAIHDFLLQHIVRFLIENANVLYAYDSIKVYYDNGQRQIKNLLKEAFSIFAAKTVFVDDVRPRAYRLFQAADVLCTLELIRAKLQAGCHLNKSEFDFFNGFQNLNRNYFKVIDRKQCR